MNVLSFAAAFSILALSAGAASAEEAATTHALEVGELIEAGALRAIGWSAVRSEFSGICYAGVFGNPNSGFILTGTPHGPTSIIIGGDGFLPADVSPGDTGEVVFRLDLPMRGVASIPARYPSFIFDRVAYAVVDNPTPTLLALLRAHPEIRVSIEGGGDLTFSTSEALGSDTFAEALAEWERCLVQPSQPAKAQQNSRPSFDCSANLSASERTICRTPDLADWDARMAPLYQAALTRAEDWAFVGDGSRGAKEWFTADALAALQERNQCQGDDTCLRSWFAKREGLLRFLGESDIGFGDSGITSVVQLSNNDVIISYAMATYRGNIYYDASESTYLDLPNGTLTILQENPTRYRLEGEKLYWEAGGPFWMNSIRDHQDQILSIPAGEASRVCMSRNEFIQKSSFSEDDLSQISQNEICVEQ